MSRKYAYYGSSSALKYYLVAEEGATNKDIREFYHDGILKDINDKMAIFEFGGFRSDIGLIKHIRNYINLKKALAKYDLKIVRVR